MSSIRLSLDKRSQIMHKVGEYLPLLQSHVVDNMIREAIEKFQTSMARIIYEEQTKNRHVLEQDEPIPGYKKEELLKEVDTLHAYIPALYLPNLPASYHDYNRTDIYDDRRNASDLIRIDLELKEPLYLPANLSNNLSRRIPQTMLNDFRNKNLKMYRIDRSDAVMELWNMFVEDLYKKSEVAVKHNIYYKAIYTILNQANTTKQALEVLPDLEPFIPPSMLEHTIKQKKAKSIRPYLPEPVLNLLPEISRELLIQKLKTG